MWWLLAPTKASVPVLPCYTEYVKSCTCSHFETPWHMFNCILALQSREESGGFHNRKKKNNCGFLASVSRGSAQSSKVCSSPSQGAWDFPRKNPFFPWVVRVAGWGGCLVGQPGPPGTRQSEEQTRAAPPFA